MFIVAALLIVAVLMPLVGQFHLMAAWRRSSLLTRYKYKTHASCSIRAKASRHANDLRFSQHSTAKHLPNGLIKALCVGDGHVRAFTKLLET